MKYTQSTSKLLNILDYALCSLWRGKLKNFSIIIVFGAVIFLLASFQLTTRSLTKLAHESLVHGPDIIVQKMSAGRQESIPLSYINRLNSIFGIRKIVPRVWGYYFDTLIGANYTVIGIERQQIPDEKTFELNFSQGTYPKEGEVALGIDVLQAMNLGNRKVFSLYRPDLSLKSYKLSGVFDRITQFLTGDTMLMSIEDSRDLFAIKADKVTDFCIYIANPKEIETIAKKISNLLPDTRVVTQPQIRKTYQMVFSWRSGFASVCLITSLAAFIIFAWDKASGLSPEEKKEVAILKILGWQTTDVLTMRLWEGVTVAMFSFILGYSLAFVHVFLFSAGLFRPVLVGWSVIYPKLQLVPEVVLSDILLIFCLSVLPYLAATVIPAWRNSIIPPDSALH